MKKIKFIILASLFILFYATRVNAQTTNLVSMFIENDQAVSLGSPIIVGITAAIAEPIHGFSFQLVYDPVCLELREHNPGELFQGALKAPVPQNKPKIVDVVYTLMGDVSGVTGEGQLAYVTFDALDTCDTMISLQEVSLVTINTDGIAKRINDIELGMSSVIISVGDAFLTKSEPAAGTWLEPEIEQVLSEGSDGSAGDGQGLLVSGEIWEPAPEVAQPEDQTPTSFGWLALDVIWLISAGLLVASTLVSSLVTVSVFRGRKKQVSYKKVSSNQPTASVSELPRRFISPPVVPTISWHDVPYLISPRGEHVYLAQDRFVIGRHPNCDLPMDDIGVSRQHTEIISKDGQYFIADMGSSNGTYLNGQPLGNRYQSLKEGDQIHLGKTIKFRFCTPTQSQVSAGAGYMVTQMQ